MSETEQHDWVHELTVGQHRKIQVGGSDYLVTRGVGAVVSFEIPSGAAMGFSSCAALAQDFWLFCKHHKLKPVCPSFAHDLAYALQSQGTGPLWAALPKEPT